MKVTLDWATPRADEKIAYIARVSNPNRTEDYAPRLIRYLIRHKEWSPFEMANVCFQIETTRDISRQILRHRSFHFQEFSQRYAEVQQPYMLREPRIQHPTNRQMSLPLTDPETEVGTWFYDAQEELVGHAWHIYRKALEQGIAKEQARALLPEGLSPTVMHMNGTVRDWIHYTTLRCAEGTQPEHREVACAIDEILEQLLPSTWEAVKEYRNGYD